MLHLYILGQAFFYKLDEKPQSKSGFVGKIGLRKSDVITTLPIFHLSGKNDKSADNVSLMSLQP